MSKNIISVKYKIPKKEEFCELVPEIEGNTGNKRCWRLKDIKIKNKIYRFRLDTENNLTKDPILDLNWKNVDGETIWVPKKLHHTFKTQNDNIYSYKYEDNDTEYEFIFTTTFQITKPGNACIRID